MMNLKKTLWVAAALLSGASTPFAQTYTSDELAFIAGSAPEPQAVKRLLSAGKPSDVLLLAIAPEKLEGFSAFKLDGKRGIYFPEMIQKKPKLGKISGKSSTLSPEKIVALSPDLIVDLGNFTPNYKDQAKKTHVQTKVPYVLLNGGLDATPAMLREAGKLLDVTSTTEPQAQWAEAALAVAAEHRAHETRTVYLARGNDGLQTGEPGSIHTETLEKVGLKNVVAGTHKGLTQISPEQLLLWDPDMIFTEYPAVRELFYTNPKWARLKAVKAKQIFVVPAVPFNWVDSPPSINRLLGLKWLSAKLDGKPKADMLPDVKSFYKTFYHYDLSDEQAMTLLDANE